MLEKYGSQLIKVIKFRDSFVMIGQRGLVRGKAIEMVGFSRALSPRDDDWSSPSINPKAIGISHQPHMSVVAPSSPVSETRLVRLDMTCSSILVGQITPFSMVPPDVRQEGKLVIGSVIKNCGLPARCQENEFAVHVYTGKDVNDEPKICVDGKYVIAKGINDAGRGLNIVVVSNGKEVIRTGHFDTWQEGKRSCQIRQANAWIHLSYFR
jgi:hypothetical protein